VATAFTLGPTIASGILASGRGVGYSPSNIPFGLVAILIQPEDIAEHPASDACLPIFQAPCWPRPVWPFIMGNRSAAHHASPQLILIELCRRSAAGRVLIRREADHPAPVLPIDLFRSPLFALSTATAICSFAVQGLAFVSLPFYFEDILRPLAGRDRFLMTPWPLGCGDHGADCGTPVRSLRRGCSCGLGLALLGLGMALLAMLPANPAVADIVWRMAICGCGFGFFQAPNMKALMSSAPADRSGSASGIVATARLIGQTSGAALAASCFGLAGREGATLALGARRCLRRGRRCVMSSLTPESQLRNAARKLFFRCKTVHH